MKFATGFLALAASALAIAPSASAQAPGREAPAALFDANGYRIDRYRTPIRHDPDPAQRLALAAALTLEPGVDALFLDVMPVESGLRDPVTGAWTINTPHLTIPGAVWHPEAGRMPADDDLWRTFEHQARQATPMRPVIVFCRVDCWMSWNAAKRLAESGIDNVWWLAEGTDGWHAAGRDLVVANPISTPASR